MTPFGKVTIGGSTKPNTYDAINGFVAVDVPSELSDEDLSSLDCHVNRILQVLSLANGRSISWSFRRVFRADGRAQIHFRGSTVSTDPRFPHLRLEPILRTAIDNYTEGLCEETGIDVAMKWFLMHPRYTEAEYLCGMTGLEHMIDVFSKRHPQGRLIKRKEFRKIRKCLGRVLRWKLRKGGIGRDVFDEMDRGLGWLNSPSLRKKTNAFLEHYRVPVEGIDLDVRELVGMRNDIVHRGRAEGKKQAELERYAAALRELIVRTFMNLIGYRGQYCSYHDGRDFRQFGTE